MQMAHPNNCSFAVIRYENSGDTAKIFVYMDMCIDLWVLLHVQECFHVCILAVCHRIDKYVGCNYALSDKAVTEKTELYGHKNSEKRAIYSLIIQEKCDMLLAY